jgi:hypothetical protein
MSVDVQYEWIAGTLASDAVQVERRTQRHDNAVVWVPAVVLVTVLAVALLWYPLLRATGPDSITYNEGWNVYWQQATAAGLPLYQAPAGLTIAHYPPLAYHLVRFLGAVADINLAGRMAALVPLGLVCLLAGMIGARFSGSRLAGWYAGICPLVWLGVFSPIRFAANDPQWLGMVLELLGFCVFLRRGTSVSGVCGAAVLFALGVFTKDSLIAAPVAVGLRMALMRDWRRLGVFIGAGVAVSGILLAVTVIVAGHFLLDQVPHARVVSYEAVQHTIMTYALLFPPAILVGGIWSARHIGSDRYGLLAFGWVVANALGVGLSFGHGVANNILFEALVFDAIVVAVACQGFLEGHERRRCAFLLMLNAVWPVVLLPAALTDGPHEWEMLGRARVALRAGADVGAAPAGLVRGSSAAVSSSGQADGILSVFHSGPDQGGAGAALGGRGAVG